MASTLCIIIITLMGTFLTQLSCSECPLSDIAHPDENGTLLLLGNMKWPCMAANSVASATCPRQPQLLRTWEVLGHLSGGCAPGQSPIQPLVAPLTKSK